MSYFDFFLISNPAPSTHEKLVQLIFLIKGIISVFMIRNSRIYSSMNSSWNSVCVQEKQKYGIDTTFLLPICDYSPKDMGDPSSVARKSIGYIIPTNLLAACAPEV